MFKALLLEKDESGFRAGVHPVDEAGLPEGDVRAAIAHSTLNYKDGLALTGKAPIVRRFPMIPGIDFAGTVEASSDPRFRPGDKVVLTGWRVGETWWGGYATRARVKGDWLVPLPKALRRDSRDGRGWRRRRTQHRRPLPSPAPRRGAARAPPFPAR